MGFFDSFRRKKESVPQQIVVPAPVEPIKPNPIDAIRIVRQDDDFEGTFEIYLQNIGSEKYTYLPMYFETIDLGDKKLTSFKHFGVSFKIFENQLYLTAFLVGAERLKFKAGSTLHLIFEGDQRLLIKFEIDAIGEPISRINIYAIKPEEMKYFTDLNLLKWKFTDNSDSYIVGDNTLFGDEQSTIQDMETQLKVLRYMSKSIVTEYLKLSL